MGIKIVSKEDIPLKGPRCYTGHYRKDIVSFLESGEKYCECFSETGASARTLLQNYIVNSTRMGNPVKAFMRQDRVFLERNDKED